jgi:uncharacterized protein with GYD domain
MPTYVVLSKWTNQGIQNVKQSATRLDAGTKAFETAGIKMTDFYLLMGQYDMLAIVDAPDDATLAKAILSLASSGNLQTETLRAFTKDEYRKIISGLS